MSTATSRALPPADLRVRLSAQQVGRTVTVSRVARGRTALSRGSAGTPRPTACGPSKNERRSAGVLIAEPAGE